MLLYNFFSIQNTLPIIVAFLTGIAGPITVAIIRHKLAVKRSSAIVKKRKEFDNTIEIQQKINNWLNTFQQNHDLDRVWVAQFHNGGNFYPGNKSMKKLSVTFESTRPGVSADIMKMQNLPVSFFSCALQEMNSSHKKYIIDTDTEDDHAFNDFWKSRGITKTYLFPITCLEGGFIALFGVDFINRNDNLSSIICAELERDAKILSGYVALVSIEKHD
jgi:hypothetical protein